jgi:hypothetical protein
MDINSAYEGLKHCLFTKETTLHAFGSSCSSKVHTKEAAIWPADGVKEKTDQDLRTSDYALSHELLVSQLLPHCQAQILPLGSSEIYGMQLRQPPEAVDGMLRMLLPAVEDLLSPQGSQHPVAAVSGSVLLEQSPLEIVSGTHGQVSTTSTMESSNCSHAQIPDIDLPVVFPSLPTVPVNPDQEPLYLVNQGPRSLNFIDYWSYKTDTWSMASQYWGCEAERCAAAATWWNMECSKWAGISNAMAQTASICASLEAHWAQSAEQARLLHELWVFNFHEMSVWQVNLARSGICGPPCSLTKSFPACQPTVQLLNLRREADVDGYPDSISAEMEWISAGGGEVELWSTASTAFVPSACLGSHSKTQASSPSSLDSPLDEGSSNVPEAVAANKLADERLANTLWDLTNILDVNAAIGVGLPTLATFFLSGFKPLLEVLSFLLENRSLPDIMARESLYSEVLFLLQALSSHMDTVPSLCMPISCPSMQSNPSCQAHSSLFEALQHRHQRAEDMLSETLVRVDNEHDATRKNLNFIGDLEDAFDIVQASLEHLQTG